MTRGEALALGTARLRAAGIEAPQREARLLLAAAAGIEPGSLLAWAERPLEPAAEPRFLALVERRAGREPLSRVLGRREFWSLPLTVTPDTLDPRPDTETVVEAALAHLPDRTAPLRILDLGTGTGCLLLALLTELPNATGVGVDRSPAAARVARANAAALGFAGRARFLVGDWAAPLKPGVDLAVSNPPYIRSEDIAGLAPEVRDHDPHLALDGGADGLDCYRRLAPALGRLLAPGGLAVLEVGRGQAGAVAALLADAGLRPVETRRDLAGVARAVVARQP